MSAVATATTAPAAGTTATRRRARLGATVWVCVVVVGLAALIGIIGPVLTPNDPNQADLAQAWIGPGEGHLLGLDVQGRDVLSRVLAGARSSLLGPLLIVVLCMLVGSVLGLASAWRGGAVDTTVSAGLDVLFAFPGVLLAALTAAVFGAGLWAAVLAMAVAYTPFVARLLRSAMLKERSQPYIAALEVQGLGATAICVRHLLPNVFPFMVAQASILFGYAVLDLAVISYLGIGVQPPNPDWGVMISENQSGILLGYPMPALAAGVCIVVVVVAMNLLGERLLERAGKEGGR
ncbi:ABC transporter permease [Nocardioides sp. NBC_00163]|uniref:ABC transporter permease n=1 Tax=Nocardioides sp. NBC_00163 TaxID=2975999 RepID=UPI00324ECF28